MSVYYDARHKLARVSSAPVVSVPTEHWKMMPMAMIKGWGAIVVQIGSSSLAQTTWQHGQVVGTVLPTMTAMSH